MTRFQREAEPLQFEDYPDLLAEVRLFPLPAQGGLARAKSLQEFRAHPGPPSW